MEVSFVGACNSIRTSIKSTAESVKSLKEATKNSETDGKRDDAEMLANLTLCYRHLEDASMRLGKAIQAADGGVSVYDRDTTVGA